MPVRAAGPVVTYAAVLVAPLVFLVGIWLFTDDELEEVEVSPEPVVAPVTEREVRDEQQAQVDPEWDTGLPLRAPEWQGTVTAVYVDAGDTVSHGDRVLAVDGVDRIVAHSAAPFHRPLAVGETSADMEPVHELLVGLGYLDEMPGDPEFFTWETSVAVEEFEADLGVESPTGDFDPSLVAWLPREEMTLGTLEVELAAPAPAGGTPFAEEAPRLLGAELVPASPGEALNFEDGVEYVAIADDERFAVDPSNPAIAEEELGAFAEVLDPADEAPAVTVERAEVVDALAVPATSVVANPAGDLCAWVAAGDGFEAREVTPGTSRAGVTDIVEGLEPGDEVLVNPGEVLEAPGCP